MSLHQDQRRLRLVGPGADRNVSAGQTTAARAVYTTRLHRRQSVGVIGGRQSNCGMAGGQQFYAGRAAWGYIGGRDYIADKG